MKAAESALIDQDYDLFIIDAPVGFGKSPVHVGIAKMFHDKIGVKAFYITPQIVLQEQLARDFPQMPQINAKRNYSCIEDTTPGSTTTCDVGSCLRDLHADRYPSCPFYPKKDPETRESMDCECLYYHARYIASHSTICGTNAAYFIKARFLGGRGLLIVDEAHGVPEWCIGQISAKISKWDVKIDEWPPATNDFDSSVDWIKTIAIPSMVKKHHELDRYLYGLPYHTHDKIYAQKLKDYNHLGYTIANINRMIDDYEAFHEEWIMKLDISSSIEYTPITSTRFLGGLMWNRGNKIIVSSGTISPEYYYSEAGLGCKAFDAKDCVFSVESPFDPTRSPIYYVPIGKMSYYEKDKTRPLIMQEINKVISRRRDRRGIIHTFTYDNAEYVQQHIASDLRPLLVMQDRKHRDASLKTWLADTRPASVFVSTAMTEGIDLKDDLCRYQIYMKVGYLNMKDPRVAKRLHLGHNKWYKYQAIEDIEQASGRATRSNEDWSEMFIFDSCFGSLKRQFKKYFKNWFLERVVEHQITDDIAPLYQDKSMNDGD